MITVIVPTLNEKDNVEHLAEKIKDVLKQDYEIIFVDHNSDDGTVEKINQLEERSNNIRTVLKGDREGLGAAIIQGLEAAKGDIIVQIDADFSHPAEKIPDLIQQLNNGRDLAIGSRYIEGGGRNDPFHRRVFPIIGSILYTKLLSSPVKDFTSGFKAYSQKSAKLVLENKENFPRGFHFQASSLFYLLENEIDVVEVPIEFSERRSGKPKYGFGDLIDNGLLFGKLFTEKHKNFWKLGVVGTSTALLNMATLFLLTEFFGVYYLFSAAIAVELSIISNFVLDNIWDLAERGRAKLRNIFRCFKRYNLVSLSGLILNLLILWFLTDIVGIYYLISNLVAIIMLLGWNFVFRDKWVLKR